MKTMKDNETFQRYYIYGLLNSSIDLRCPRSISRVRVCAHVHHGDSDYNMLKYSVLHSCITFRSNLRSKFIYGLSFAHLTKRTILVEIFSHV